MWISPILSEYISAPITTEAIFVSLHIFFLMAHISFLHFALTHVRGQLE
jgi:hypothetical protein